MFACLVAACREMTVCTSAVFVTNVKMVTMTTLFLRGLLYDTRNRQNNTARAQKWRILHSWPSERVEERNESCNTIIITNNNHLLLSAVQWCVEQVNNGVLTRTNPTLIGTVWLSQLSSSSSSNQPYSFNYPRMSLHLLFGNWVITVRYIY